MKKVKEPAPHVKAAKIEKEAVRALSVDEVEEALTKSTFGAIEKDLPDDVCVKDIEAENNELRRDNNNLLIEYFGLKEENEQLRKNAKEAERCYHGVRIELMDRNKEITKLKKTIEELRAINEEWAGGKKGDVEVLKAECVALKEEKKQLERHVELADAEISTLKDEKKKLLRELDEMKKTISKMKYAHEEEVRALEDDLAESKILNKKAGEYSSMLDADSDAFETILGLAKVIHGLAKSTESISLLIKDEVEGHV